MNKHVARVVLRNVVITFKERGTINSVVHFNSFHQLPLDLQDRVRSYLTKEELEELEDTKDQPSELSHSVHLPMSTFPPTAVFSAPVRKCTSEIDAGRNDGAVPMSLIAKALLQSNDRPLLTRPRHNCSSNRKYGSGCKAVDAESQTVGLALDQSGPYHLQNQPLMKNSLSGPPGVHKGSKLVSNSR